MNSFLVAIIQLLLWAIGYFVYGMGIVIHVLLGIALIAVGFLIIQERKLKVKLHGRYF